MSFAKEFLSLREQYGPLCIGLDPAREVLMSWGLSADYQGLTQFCSRMLEAAQQTVGVIKPQVAFFELYGVDGFRALTDVIHHARQSGVAVIVDAKRGDIGSTVDAYGKAWLGDESSFKADALTVNAFLGFDALKPLLDQARDTATGVFVVVQSSNKEGAQVQDAVTAGKTIAVDLAQRITAYNAGTHMYENLGLIGAVIGATLGEKSRTTIDHLPHSLFLVPGIGSQGGKIEDLPHQFAQHQLRNVIPSVSRAITAAGPDTPQLRKNMLDFAEKAKRL